MKKFYEIFEKINENLDKICNMVVIYFPALFLVISLISLSDSPFEKVNKFDSVGFKESESYSEPEIIILEIVDKTPIRMGLYRLLFANDSYLLKVKSDKPLYDGKTIAVSKEDYYEKYEIGESYPFTLETQTNINTKITP